MNTKPSYLSTLSSEQREELRLKGLEVKAQKAIDRANNIHNLKLDYLDHSHWASLASSFGIRMPNIADKTTTGVITKYLKKLSIPRELFDEHYTSASYFIKNNSKWSAYATVGLLCELKKEIQDKPRGIVRIEWW